MAATDMIRGRQTATRTLTNKSGGAVAVGDVVVIGDGTNDNAFTTTTTASFNARMVGVAMEAIANNAAGLVAISGYVPIVVTNASVARDVFLFTHTVAKQAAGNATRSAGAFGQVLETGTSPEAIIWGMPDVTPAAGGSVATDAIWDAAGDGVFGTGANTAARIAMGAVGGWFGRVNGAIAWTAGTAFPTAAAGDLFHRTDLSPALWRYDGTRWRCVCPHTITIPPWNTTLGTGTTVTQSGALRCAVPGLSGGSDLWLLSTTLEFYVNGGTALSGSHSWIGTLDKVVAAGTETTIATFTINSGSSSVFRSDDQAIGALLNNGTTHFIFTVDWTKTGTPGNLLHWATLTYQYVAT